VGPKENGVNKQIWGGGLSKGKEKIFFPENPIPRYKMETKFFWIFFRWPMWGQ
jgi:hypothetical protein